MNEIFGKILSAVGVWLLEIFESIRKDPIRKIVLILISPIIINAIAEAILDFSWIATVGYYSACILGFSKILDDPSRVVKWGVGYVIGAVAVKMIVENMIPAYDGNDAVSLISVFVIGYVILAFYLKARELKNS
ncbi:hypothetical protein J4453_01470 [Candidatus Woesearchaeota archaeon]|nr:hypothetical protein [Candidatus Woesearchaeota archaeon]